MSHKIMGTLEIDIEQAIQEYATPRKVPSFLPDNITTQSIAQTIDHTLLSPSALPSDIESVCKEAVRLECRTVCIHAIHLPLAVELLKVCQTTEPICVIGFPSGAIPTVLKVAEASWAVSHGAREIDMVISIGHLKAKEYLYVHNEIKQVVSAAGTKVPVKVILETGALERPEIIAGCVLVKEAGAAFVKTSTGFGPGGATVEDISLMRAVVGEKIGVKASGGIRDWEKAKAMLQAGASRIGASSSVKILDEVARE